MMRRFAHVLYVLGFAVGGLFCACSAQEGVLLHIELTSDATLPTLQHLELYVGAQVDMDSSFPMFTPNGPTFEREVGTDVGNDKFLLSNYNVDSAFDLMLPLATLPTLPMRPAWRQVLVVGSIKDRDGNWQAVALGERRISGTAGRVNRYDIVMRAIDGNFKRAGDCVAWKGGLVIKANVGCPDPECVPLDPDLNYVDINCDGIDGDCNGAPALGDAGKCMRAYPSSGGVGRLCNLIDSSSCNEIEAHAEEYLCRTGEVAATTCVSVGHCDGTSDDGHYVDKATLGAPVVKLLQDKDVTCKIPVDGAGVPCRGVTDGLIIQLGEDPDICRTRFGTRYVDEDYDTVGVWKVQPTIMPTVAPCEGHFQLDAPPGSILPRGTVVLGAHRTLDQLRVGLVVDITPVSAEVDISGICVNLSSDRLCEPQVHLPAECF